MVCVFAAGGFKVGKYGCLGGKKRGQVSFLILHRASKIPSEFSQLLPALCNYACLFILINSDENS